MEEEILSEEKYKKSKNKLIFVALIVLVIGLLAGGTLIKTGLDKQKGINSKYSTENKLSISDQIEAERKVLEARKVELESKGIKFSNFAKYTDGEAYELKLIVNVLDPSFAYYKFDEYKNNPVTSKYCSLKNQSENINNDFNKDFDSFDSIPFFMFGGFIIFAFCIISGSIYAMAQRREIMAYQVQQVMPVAQEGLEKMAPTVAKVSKNIMEEMAPTYGNLAKEISKGIKEGIDKDATIFCKHCGEEIEADSKFCSNCGKEI